MGSPKTCGIIKVAVLTCRRRAIHCHPVDETVFANDAIVKASEVEIGDAFFCHKNMRLHWIKRMFPSTNKCLVLRNKKLFRGLMNQVDLLIYDIHKEATD